MKSIIFFMGNFLDKMERKIGKYAIKNLSRYLIGAYAIGYVLYFLSTATGTNILGYLTLEPYFILRGQIWRLITWVLIPYNSLSGLGIIFAIIMMVLYYQLGTVLERTWGTFRFNVYIFGGIILTIISAFILHAICVGVYGPSELKMVDGYRCLAYGDRYFINGIGGMFSTSYINQSIFLAFAVCYPNMEVMLYFILPIKMKWMAIFYAVLTVINLIRADWAGKIAIFASVLNFVIFFFTNRQVRDTLRRFNPKEVKRKQAYRAATGQGRGYGTAGGGMRSAAHSYGKTGVAKHKCAVCGRTELDDPTLEFRFCSKCEGNYEYCQDHLFTHQHVKRS